MAYQDKTLVCAQCRTEFVFTAGEQQFFAEKGLTTEPKRCKGCRASRKGGRAKSGDGIYRSPAFEDSAPSHQKVRGRPQRGRGGGEYRAPGFREHAGLDPEREYRSPAFRDRDKLSPEQEYRAPGFQESAGLNAEEEYRAPGFRDLTERYRDEKPMFSIVCSACGKEAMIPVLPEEREEAFCPECHAERRRAARAARAAVDCDQGTASGSGDPPEE